MNLSNGWKVKDYPPDDKPSHEIAQPDYVDYFWIETNVPADVHTILKDNHLIEDPFYAHNDLKCRWVEEKEWWFRKTFQWEPAQNKNERQVLTFHGLDTFATIYLNGLEVGSTENMFIAHSFDVTRLLDTGRNTLAVKFDPVAKHVGDKIKYHWSGFSKERIWTRKMQSQYGWDWGPRLLTAGIWKDVELNTVPATTMKDVYAFTKEITEDHAILNVEMAFDNLIQDSEYVIEAVLSNQKHQIVNTAVIDSNQCTLEIDVADPDLWWTHDLGEPNLYELCLSLNMAGERVDSYSTTIGLRTIDVKTETVEGDGAFTFVLNGVELFAKGANWIPIDSFVAGVENQRYEEMIDLSVKANMNMLRVWGGGIYEKDIFYQQCNQKGVLVWQDFMFACALYPDYNKNFMRNVEEEIDGVVRHLRNHPCLALWCGNNENDWLHEALASSGEIKDPFYGEQIYHALIPKRLKQLDPIRFYWPSSPYGGNDHNSRTVGDTHNWQVWHGNIEPRLFGEPQNVDYSIEGISFKNFKNDNTRFCSEFGMHASSNVLTLKENIPMDQFYWGSPEMDYRNKDIHHQKGILLMEGYTGIPENINDYVMFSMLTQAEGLKFGVEHYRRNKAVTSGALIWQLNDCWPGTSWSLIDYYRLPKASYYYARRFFDPVLFSLDFNEEEKKIALHLTNDLRTFYRDDLKLSVITFNGDILYEKEWSADCPPNTTRIVDAIAQDTLFTEAREDEVYLKLTTGTGYRNLYYLKDQKDLNLKNAVIKATIDFTDQSITLLSDVLVRMAVLEPLKKGMLFSDNFVDLEPGIPFTITLQNGSLSEKEWRQLKIKTMNESKVHVQEK